MFLKLRLLGGARVERDGTVIAGRATQRRRLAVLAMLALASNRTLPRDRILGVLWPDHAPDAARRLLSEALYVIRRELGEDTILTTGDEVTLGPGMLCDVDLLIDAVSRQDAPEIARLASGPLFDAWSVRGASEFDRWMETERTRINQLIAAAMESAAKRAERAGDWGNATKWWRYLAQASPYNTASTLRAASALSMAGERALALQLLLAHAELLRNDLELEPGAAFDALLLQIRSGEQLAESVAGHVSIELADRTAAFEAMDSQVDTAVGATSGGAAKLQVPARTDRGRQRLPRLLAIAITLTLVVAGSWAFSRWRTAPLWSGNGASDDARDRRRLAVLYFADASENQELGYLADGLTENLIGVLSRVPGLQVASVERARRVRALPPDSVAVLLGVRTLLMGVLERSGGQVRVAVRLIDAENQEQVGALVAESKLSEPLELQDALAARVAVELVHWIGRGIRIGEARDAARLGGRSNRALELLLRGERLRKDAERLRVTTGRDSTSADRARALLSRADQLLSECEQLDPSWPAPSIERGWIAMTSGMLENGVPRVLSLSLGIAHAERAMTLLSTQPSADSLDLARTLYLRGLLRVRSATAIQTFRPESSTIRLGESDLAHAVALDETLAGAWAALALPRWIRGDFAGVELAVARAFRADPYLEDAAGTLGWAWRAAAARGDHASASRWCARGHAQLVDDWHFVECELTLMRLDVARLSGRAPDTARAWALVAQLDSLDPPARARLAGRAYSPTFRRMLATMVSASVGDTARALRVLQQANAELRGDPERSTDLLYETACLRYVLGQHLEGERALAAYLQARPDLAGFIRRDATVARLRLTTAGY